MANQINIAVPQILQAVQGMRQLSQQTASFGQQLQRVPRASSNPLVRAAQAQANVRAALAGGSPTALFGARYQAAVAQRSLLRAQNLVNGGPSTGQRLSQAVLSTRVNLPGIGGVGASPLVGRSLMALGMSGPQAAIAAVALAALVVQAKAAVEAVKLFTGVLTDSASGLGASGAARTISGGTSGQIALLQAMGLNPGDIPGMAAGLQSRLAAGGTAAMFGQRLGVGPQLPRPFGKANEAENFVKIIDQLSQMTDETKQLAFARALELDAMLPQIQAFGRNRQAILADAAVRKQIADPRSTRIAQDFALSLQRVQGNWELVIQAFGKAALPDFTAGLNTLADLLRMTGDYINQHPEVVQGLMDAAKGTLQTIADFTSGFLHLRAMLVPWDPSAQKQADLFDSASKEIGDLFNQHRQQIDAANQASALDANTRALDANTGALKTGTYGGGDRTRGAFPRAWTGWAFNNAVAGSALRLGAFSF